MYVQRENGFGLAKPALKFWLLGVALASLSLFMVIFSGALEIQTWQYWARYTARLSFAIFLITYLTAPLYQLYKTSFTSFLRRNRQMISAPCSEPNIAKFGSRVRQKK